MRSRSAAALFLAPLLLLGIPAAAAQAPVAAAAATGYSVADTDIGTLLDDPRSKAILDKHMAGFSEQPQIAMARGMTLKSIQAYAQDKMPDKILSEIQADFDKLPPKK